MSVYILIVISVYILIVMSVYILIDCVYHLRYFFIGEGRVDRQA